MLCYKRFRPDSTSFYVDEHGKEVPEETAKQHLAANEGARHRMAEGNHQPININTPSALMDTEQLKACAVRLGMTEQEAALFAQADSPERNLSQAVQSTFGLTAEEAAIFIGGDKPADGSDTQ